MKKSTLTVLALALVLSLALVAGCGGSDSKPQAQTQTQAQPPQKQMDAHSGHAMPGGDPLPLMKDMDKSLQDMTKQVKAGQTMDAQKSAGQIASLADKVGPHISDAGLQANLRTAAGDLRDSVSGAKVDQTVVEAKLKAMQDAMSKALKNLQAGSHT